MSANGNDQLPEHRQRIVEAANAAYQTVCAERDEAERKLREMTLKYEAEVMKLEHMKNLVNMMDSTGTSHKLERDDAVIRAATLLEALNHIKDVIHRHAPGDAT